MSLPMILLPVLAGSLLCVGPRAIAKAIFGKRFVADVEQPLSCTCPARLVGCECAVNGKRNPRGYGTRACRK